MGTPSNPLRRLEHIGLSIFDELAFHSLEKVPATHDVKYWGGAEQPWRNGTTDEPYCPMADAPLIAREELARRAAQSEDTARCPTLDDHADMLHGCALRADFLFALTFTLRLWSWKTWEIVQYLVKPATEGHGRCRFAHLPFVKPFTGPATVFLSHCWGGTWGDLVVAACAGGRMDRYVWVDIAAVRQWPGNEADLNFRPVVSRCRALLVAAAPVPGIVSSKSMGTRIEFDAYLASDDYKAATKTLAFCRLWCIGTCF